jgi:hypothetical protein
MITRIAAIPLVSHILICLISLPILFSLNLSVLYVGFKEPPNFMPDSKNKNSDIQIPLFLITCSSLGSILSICRYLNKPEYFKYSWKEDDIDYSKLLTAIASVANIIIPYLQVILIWTLFISLKANPAQFNPKQEFEITFFIAGVISGILGFISIYFVHNAGKIFR